jgi:hypothetical protein
MNPGSRQRDSHIEMMARRIRYEGRLWSERERLTYIGYTLIDTKHGLPKGGSMPQRNDADPGHQLSHDTNVSRADTAKAGY